MLWNAGFGLLLDNFGRRGSSSIIHQWKTFSAGVKKVFNLKILVRTQVLPDCYSEASGGVIFGKPENILRSHKYVPIIIGKKIVEKMERLSFLTFWQRVILVYIRYLLYLSLTYRGDS